MNTLQHIDAGRSHTVLRAHHLSPYFFDTCILDAGRTTSHQIQTSCATDAIPYHIFTFVRYETLLHTPLIPVSSKLAELVWCKP